MKIYRKIITIALTLALVICAVPISANEASATNIVKGKFSRENVLKDSEGRSYCYPKDESRFMQIYFTDYINKKFKVGNCSEGALGSFRRYEVNGEIAYCVEHGVEVEETAMFNGSVPEESMLEKIYKNEKKEYILKNICLCLFYGRQNGSRMSDLLDATEDGGLGFRNSRYYGLNSRKYTLDDWYAATMQLIHETQQQFRTEKFNLKTGNDLEYTNGLRMNDGTRFPGNGKNIRNTHYSSALKGKGAYDIYKFMEQQIKKHFNISSSVGGASREKPVHINLTKNQETGIWESRPIYVKPSVASKLKVVKKNGKSFKDIRIELKRDSDGRWYYKYIYNTAGEPNTKDTFTIKRAVEGREDFTDTMLIWECRDGRGGHEQALTTGAADPICRFVKFTTEKILSPPSGEKPKPEYFPTIEIPIKKQDLNPGWDGDINTPMGDAALDATYTLYKSVNGGEEVAVDWVTLDEYGSWDLLIDTPFSNSEELRETESGEKIHTQTEEEEVSTTHCTVSPTKIEWTGNVLYRVVETRPDGRYVQPDKGYREYSFNYYAVSNDTRSCVDEPENWSDIDYKIEYATTSGTNGSNDYVTGTAETLNADGALTFSEETFINDCYRGKFTLSKSLENEDVFNENGSGLQGGQRDSTKSMWKIRLKSGGYENSPYIRFIREEDETSGTAVYKVVRDLSGKSNWEESIKIGSNGDLFVYDIPYGEYVVEEYDADDDSFVLEQFTLFIGEHKKSTYFFNDLNDNRYDYNIRDKKKTNIIKIIKTNAETGKIVPASGTRFYLRYMGNPLNTPQQNRELPNYGRLLPNAEEITRKGPYTFEVNSNGKITVPYELEYGIYRLEEWLLPEGYFVGAYDENGNGSSHNYGTVEEGQTEILTDINSFDSLVKIYDENGNPIKYKDKSEYVLGDTSSDKALFNYYTFNVDKQKTHVDGNFGQCVDCDGNIAKADSSYRTSDYPYVAYYKAVAMANNSVKGRIKVKKTGEYLHDFNEEYTHGRKVFQPVYKNSPLPGAVFGIFAAEDILLNDGKEGPEIYDAKTNKQIIIPQKKSTHAKSFSETIKNWFGKVFFGSVYEEGELDHYSGAKLWYLKDRTQRKDGKNTILYVSPEQKDSTYMYTYETTDVEKGYKIRYDMSVTLKRQASGKKVTHTKMIKTTSPVSGFLPEISRNQPSATVCGQVLEPIDNFFLNSEADKAGNRSKLTVAKEEYIYEADGKQGNDQGGNSVNFGDIGVSRYKDKKYEQYKLSENDLSATSGNLEEEGGTKEIYVFERDKNVELINPETGGNAVIRSLDGFLTYTRGYYLGGEFIDEPSWIPSDENGEILKSYEIPEGWTQLKFEGDTYEDPNLIIVSKEENHRMEYKVLLSDGRWQSCDQNGNFQKMIVQVYDAEVVCDESNGIDFSIRWDGFEINSSLDRTEKNTIIRVTKQNSNIIPIIDLGIGYYYENDGNTTAFIADKPSSPLYFKNNQGIITEMFYAGGEMKTKLTIPESAVETYYEGVMPKLKFKNDNGIIDWYSDLSPDKPVKKQNQSDNLSWIARRIENNDSEISVFYTLEIVTNAKQDESLEVAFEDGYTMTMFCDKAETGNEVGVIIIDGIYKTNRHTMSKLIETITTGPDGEATTTNLDLGKYIVRELCAPKGYVRDDREYEVELKYNDQYTPLVWKNIETENRHYSVELNFKKVFETSYKSCNYLPGGGAQFGIYNVNPITYNGKTIKADSLLNSIFVNNTGIVRAQIKVPKGTYYLKELQTSRGYLLCDIPFYFMVGEDEFSYDPFTIKDDQHGIYAKGYVNGYENVRLKIKILRREPYSNIIIKGESYSLGSPVKEKDFNIKVSKDATWINYNITPSNQADILLPNGKRLLIKSHENTYEYSYDGNTGKYIPRITDTGYFARYSLDMSLEEGNKTVVLTAANESSEIVVEKSDNRQNQEEPQKNFVTVSHETLGEPVRIERGKSQSLRTSDGAKYVVKFTDKGVLKLSVFNTSSGAITKENEPKVTVNGIKDPSIEIYKSVTMARQDSFSENVQILINTCDNLSAGQIKNNMLPPENPPYYPPDNPNIGRLNIFKADKSTDKALKGAVFEVWDSKVNEMGILVPNKIVFTGITDEDGFFNADVNYGTLFYREIKAPDGYITDGKFHKVDINDNNRTIRVNMVNEKRPQISDRPFGPINPKIPKTPIIPKTPEVPDTGDYSNLLKWVCISLFFAFGVLYFLKKEKIKEYFKRVKYTKSL